MTCFSLAVTEGQMSIRTAEVRPYVYCFGRGTSVARRDQGGGLALSVGADMMQKKTKSAMKTVHH